MRARSRTRRKRSTYAKKARELAPGDPQIPALAGRVAHESGNFSWSYSLLQEKAARQGKTIRAVLYDLAWAAYTWEKSMKLGTPCKRSDG